MDQLLRLVHSDGASELSLMVGQPPVFVLEGKEQPLDGPALTKADAEKLFRDVSDTRLRRRLREKKSAEFIYRFQDRLSFVVRATIADGSIYLAIR